MKSRVALLILWLCCAAMAQQQSAAPRETAHVVNNVVFLSPGDKFGLDLAGPADGSALTITEQPDLKKATLVLKFWGESGMMFFTIENRSEHWLIYEAGIGSSKRGLYKTSVMPVGPHMSNIESWPGSIEQLALKNLSFHEKPDGKPDKK